MTQYTKGQRIEFTNFGEIRQGTIEDVGEDLLGVQQDSIFRFAADYVVINKNQVIVRQTPAQRRGLEVGDEVTVNRAAIRGLRGRIFLHYDDKTATPQFRDEFGNRHFVTLSDVTKVVVSAGPKAGVLWTDAPQGSTHYSATSHHGSKWHKLDSSGNWHFAITDSNKRSGFIKYASQRDAHAEFQVAMPDHFRNNPLVAIAAEVVELESQARTKQSQLDSLTREVARINTEKQAKLAVIATGGFKVVNGKLEPIVVSKPISEWEAGDKVRCITTTNCGMAELTVGKLYTVTDRFGVTCVRDNAGDRMGDCVKAGCFVWVEAGEDLSQVPVQRWKRGDTIRNVRDHDLGHGDITIGKEYKLLDDGCVSIRDDAGDRRHRTSSDYVLVRRA